jgi:hypothetical protein
VAILSDAFEAVTPGIDSARMLVVSGNPGDAMQLVNLSSWTVGAVQSAQALATTYGHVHQFLVGHAYKAYSLLGATVFVDEAMEVHDASVRTDAPPVKSQIFSIEQLFGSQGAAPEVAPDANDKGTAPPEDAQSNRLKGVAIVFAGTGGPNGDIATTGHYELSKDGGASWMSVGSDLSDATAVYADKTALLRYVVAEEAESTQPQSLIVRLIDDSGLNGSAGYGTASTGSTIDVSVHGESTAFGADALTLLARSSKALTTQPPDQHPVSHENDELLPVGMVGSPVSSLVGWSDTHGDKGIAITGLDTSQGTLFYSTNDGDSWTEVTHPLSDQHALLMRSDGDNRLYFKPSSGLMVRSIDALTLRAWDQSHDTETTFFVTTDDASHVAQTPESWVPQDARSDEELTALGMTTEALTQKLLAEVTAEVVAAAIATSVNASMAKVYAMPQSDSLNWGAMVSQAQTGSDPFGMSTLESGSPVVHLTMADVLRLPATNGVHRLLLDGPAHDKLMLSKGEWTDTGAVVNHNGHTYAVYAGSTDASAQLLIDQQMLNQLMSN